MAQFVPQLMKSRTQFAQKGVSLATELNLVPFTDVS